MNFIHAIVLGIVEGVSEFLPISSTGHLILTSTLLKLEHTEFLKSFEVAIQLGAILSVVVLYWRKLFVNPEIIRRIITAFIPTAIIGLMFFGFIKDVLLGNNVVVVWSLFLGGVVLLLFEWWYEEQEHHTGRLEDISYKQSLAIGLFQSIAVIPGVSRAAATIIGGLALGIKRRTIVEFSFLLAVPTMAGAVGLDIIKTGYQFTSAETGLLFIGLVVSFFTSILAIKFLIRFIQTHNFNVFGVYRILIALAFWLIIL